MISDLRGKLYLSFLISTTPLLIFAIALSICCLKLSFSSSIRPRRFLQEAHSTIYDEKRWQDELKGKLFSHSGIAALAKL